MSSLAPGVKVTIEPSGSAPIAGVGTSTAAFLLKVADASPLVGKATLITSYDAFAKFLPAATDNPNTPGPELALAAVVVHGFFLNGGTRCHVIGYTATPATWATALAAMAKIDEVAIVVAPGADTASQTELAGQCKTLGDRFAVLDGPAGVHRTFALNGKPVDGAFELPAASDHAAYYYPWISIRDPFAAKPGTIEVPPSGHVAGVYARVDATRGVHKAPANEEIRGALGVAAALTDTHQAAMNDLGVNAIRLMQGGVRIWGARTLGGEVNGETKHVNVRRTLLFLRESIDEGLQWVVFEPNTPALWARVRRNVGAFLHDVWASGALFGTTAEEAYYVTCNEELNPSSMRDNGQLNLEVGVALVRPAEFVAIRIRQWSGANS